MTDREAAAERRQAARVLVVDDEPQIRRLLEISLRSQGYVPLLAANGREGLEAVAREAPDIVVLDLGLPDQDGGDVLRRLRQSSRVPVLVLTVRSNEAEKVALLDAGADDYVTKPFGLEELMARIRVLLRKAATMSAVPPAFDDGSLHIDFAKREVRLQGEPIALSRKEYALLELLARHPDRLLTQSQILSQIWGPSHEGDAHYLRIVVGKLRHKLGDAALAPRYIHTEPGVGLRFITAR